MYLSGRAQRRRRRQSIEYPQKDSRGLLSALTLSSSSSSSSTTPSIAWCCAIIIINIIGCLATITDRSGSGLFVTPSSGSARVPSIIMLLNVTHRLSCGASGGDQSQSCIKKTTATPTDETSAVSREVTTINNNNAAQEHALLPFSEKQEDPLAAPRAVTILDTTKNKAVAAYGNYSNIRRDDGATTLRRAPARLKRRAAALGSRPKIGRKILKKITPTKVLVGAHLGSWAYRRFTNWNNSTAANETLAAATNVTLATTIDTTSQLLIVSPPANESTDASLRSLNGSSSLKAPRRNTNSTPVVL